MTALKAVFELRGARRYYINPPQQYGPRRTNWPRALLSVVTSSYLSYTAKDSLTVWNNGDSTPEPGTDSVVIRRKLRR